MTARLLLPSELPRLGAQLIAGCVAASPRRRIRALVGMFWLLAGILQLQPFMFTRGFSADVLGSAALSQPGPLRAVIVATEAIVQAHPGAWNVIFAGAELVIGAGMLLARDGQIARLAACGSIVWGLGVWCVGEGVGGIFTGHAALSTGAPGAASLYVLLTIAAWPTRTGGDRAEPLPRRLLARTWVGVWILGALFALLPAQWGALGLSEQAAMGEMMSPSWTIRPTLAVTNWLHGLSPTVAATLSLLLVVLQTAVGVGIGSQARLARAAALFGGTSLAFAFWVFGQGFGGLSTGTATDVGTAPLIMLLAIALATSSPRTAPAATRVPVEPQALGIRD